MCGLRESAFVSSVTLLEKLEKDYPEYVPTYIIFKIFKLMLNYFWDIFVKDCLKCNNVHDTRDKVFLFQTIIKLYLNLKFNSDHFDIRFMLFKSFCNHKFYNPIVLEQKNLRYL